MQIRTLYSPLHLVVLPQDKQTLMLDIVQLFYPTVTAQQAEETVMVTHEGCPAPARETLEVHETYVRRMLNKATGQPLNEEIDDYNEMVIQEYPSCTFKGLLKDPKGPLRGP